MYTWEHLEKIKGYRIIPDKNTLKTNAFLTFLLRLPADTQVLLDTEDFTDIESQRRDFYAVSPEDGTPFARNTAYLQTLHVDCEIVDSVYRNVGEEIKNECDMGLVDWDVPENVLNSIHAHIRKGFNQKDSFYCDYTLTKDKESRVRRFFGSFKDIDGRSYFISRIADIGDPVAILGELEMEKNRKEILSSLLDDWVYEFNIATGKLTTISGNPAQYGITVEQGIGGSVFTSVKIHPDDKERFIKCCICDVPDGESADTEARMDNNGIYHWISLTTRKLSDSRGKTISIIGKVSDIDERKKQEIELEEKATKDSLTGLLNRNTFREKVTTKLAAKTRPDHSALVIFDIDNFKKINDRYGHLYGDTTILYMSEMLKKYSKPHDCTGRFGGDEFTMYVDEFGTDEELCRMVEEMRESFEKLCKSGKDELRITCSAGIAVYGRDGRTPRELLLNADNALYSVKEGGKNGYAICTDEIKTEFSEEYRATHAEEPIRDTLHMSEEITEFALELLEGSKDLDSAIDLLLSRIGMRFGLSAITIRETQDTRNIELSYKWFDESKTKGIEDKVVVTQAERKYVDRKMRDDGKFIFYADQEPENSPVLKLYRARDIKSIIQYPLVMEEKTFGYIAFLECEKNRRWTDEEEHSFYVVSKIVGNYLSRERAYHAIERKVEKMKSQDEVTSLLKYDKFKEVAAAVLEKSTDFVKYALLSCDIVHFNYFNELYGFRSGDEVLSDLASLVVHHNPRAVAACRDFADNFLILTTYSDEDVLMGNIKNYTKTFTATQADKFLDSNFELCWGVYILPDNKTDVVQAIDNANIARKLLKEKGQAGINKYLPSMKANRLKEIALTRMVDEAIDDDEFLPFFQPKYSLETGKLIGAEALARWEKPNGLVATPEEFIPTLEKTGKIVALDFYIFEAVLRQMRNWKQRGIRLVPVSINLSRHHIKNQGLVAKLVQLVRTYGIDARFIEIEITESAFVEDQESLIKLIKEIKEKGFLISIDDFGKGYSSLSMLTEIEADFVKIDKDFLKDSGSNVAKGMVDSVIKLVKGVGMRVVCEGVETVEQAEMLKDAGCDIGQGFYYSKPVSAVRFEKEFLLTEKTM